MATDNGFGYILLVKMQGRPALSALSSLVTRLQGVEVQFAKDFLTTLEGLQIHPLRLVPLALVIAKMYDGWWLLMDCGYTVKRLRSTKQHPGCSRISLFH